MPMFLLWLLVLCCAYESSSATASRWPAERRLAMRESVREMFHHAFDNYMTLAFPADELKPLSCVPRKMDEGRGALDDVLGDYR